MRLKLTLAAVALLIAIPARADTDVLPLSESSVLISTTQRGGSGLLGLIGKAIRGPIAEEVMSTAARETLNRGYRFFSVSQANSGSSETPSGFDYWRNGQFGYGNVQTSTTKSMSVIINMSNRKGGFDAQRILRQYEEQ